MGDFPGDTWQTCGARNADDWGEGGGSFPAARINNCLMSQWDGTSNEAEYKFSNNDDGTYTMWVDGGGKEGYYKIYNMCEDGGSKCWIQFDCLKNDKEYSDDC